MPKFAYDHLRILPIIIACHIWNQMRIQDIGSQIGYKRDLLMSLAFVAACRPFSREHKVCFPIHASSTHSKAPCILRAPDTLLLCFFPELNVCHCFLNRSLLGGDGGTVTDHACAVTLLHYYIIMNYQSMSPSTTLTGRRKHHCSSQGFFNYKGFSILLAHSPPSSSTWIPSPSPLFSLSL